MSRRLTSQIMTFLSTPLEAKMFALNGDHCTFRIWLGKLSYSILMTFKWTDWMDKFSHIPQADTAVSRSWQQKVVVKWTEVQRINFARVSNYREKWFSAFYQLKSGIPDGNQPIIATASKDIFMLVVPWDVFHRCRMKIKRSDVLYSLILGLACLDIPQIDHFVVGTWKDMRFLFVVPGQGIPFTTVSNELSQRFCCGLGDWLGRVEKMYLAIYNLSCHDVRSQWAAPGSINFTLVGDLLHNLKLLCIWLEKGIILLFLLDLLIISGLPLLFLLDRDLDCRHNQIALLFLRRIWWN